MAHDTQDGIDQAQLEILMRPLNAGRVRNRKQGSASLSYLEAFDVRATLIRLFGFGGFHIETLEAKVLDMALNEKGNNVVTAMAHVRLYIPVLGCTYSEVAASSQTGPMLGEVTDFALKTAVSDAMKRCAINLGAQFGLGLYDSGSLAEPVKVIFAQPQRDMLLAIRGQSPNGASTEEVQTMVARATQGDTNVTH